MNDRLRASALARLPAWAPDVGLGVGLGAVLIAVLAVELGRGDLGGAAWLAYGLSAIAALAVIWRRRRP